MCEEGLIDYNRNLLEIARSNVDAAFEYAQDVVGARSLSEFVDISTQYARNQSAAMTEQARDLATRAQKLAVDTAQPLAGVTSLLKEAST